MHHSSILYELLSLIYRGKTSEMSQAWSHMFLNLRHNSFQTKGRLVRMMDQNGGKLNVFKTSKKDRILSKSIFFLREFIGWYIESGKKIKIWWYGHFNDWSQGEHWILFPGNLKD